LEVLMADAAQQQLMLQIDASVELLQRNLARGDSALGAFERKTKAIAANVDQSIANMGSRFGEFAKLGEDAASRARASFEASFSGIQKLASQALRSTPAEGGALNLNAGAVREQAASYAAQASAIGQITAAAERQARAVGDTSEATRLYIQAGHAARIEAERQANAFSNEAAILDRLQAELIQTTGAQQRQVVVQRQAAASSGQLRAGTQQLSYQIGDVAASFGSGTPVIQIFAQQIGQTVQAVQLMTNASSGLLGFLAGPWGAVLTGATVILATLAMRHTDAATAQEAHKTASERLKEASDRLAGAIASVNQNTRQGIIDSINAANAMRLNEIQTRKTLQAKLALAQQDLTLSKAPQVGGMGVTQGFNPATAASTITAAELQSQIRAQNALITAAGAEIRLNEAKLVLRDVAAATDKTTAATQRYADEEGRLTRLYGSNKISLAALEQGLLRATAARDKALESAKAHGRASTSEADAQARLQAATTDTERAQANLALVRARARDDLRAGRITEEEYTARIAAATSAVRAARTATKDAAQAQRELESALESVTTRFDPAKKAAMDYLETLTQIDQLQNAGKIGAVEALDYRFRAMRASQEQDSKNDGSDWFTEYARENGTKQVDDIVAGIERAGQYQRDAEEEAARLRDDAIRNSADLYTELFRDGTSGLWRNFEEMGLQAVATVMAQLAGGDDIMTALKGGASLFGFKFGGARATGGPVSPGQAYLVGERGPEPFIPNTAGTILPNSVLRGAGGGGALSVSINVRGEEGPMFRPMIDAVATDSAGRVVGQYDAKKTKKASRSLVSN
jgi:hypothetical protein